MRWDDWLWWGTLTVVAFVIMLLSSCGLGDNVAYRSAQRHQERENMASPNPFTKIGITPVMYALDWEGHQYLVLGKGLSSAFVLHSESCPHPSHPGEIY